MPDQENKLTIYPSCLSKTIPLHPEIGKLNLIPPVIIQGKIAGLVRKAATNWSKITSDKTIVKMVQGCSIQFINNPPANLKTYQPSFSKQERALISNEIEKMKLKGAILEVPPAQHQFLGHIFLRPMKDGSQRPIFNLKKLNHYVQYQHFKMEGQTLEKSLLQPEDWMLKLDLKDAYFCVPMME